MRALGAIAFLLASALQAQTLGVAGHVIDPQGKPVVGALVHLLVNQDDTAQTKSDAEGAFLGLPRKLRSANRGFVADGLSGSSWGAGHRPTLWVGRGVVITAKTVEPGIDLRNSEVFNRTLFSRDDQVFQQLNAGIDAGQHEGGGKSLEIRLSFNLDRGVNGGLKVLVDDVSQNQATQGHGQGYLGSLKALSAELIQDVTIINGPFSPEYGDFSGLGVVHIRQRESLPDEYTARLEGGNFNNRRAFLAWSPLIAKVDAYVAYDGSYTDGPFQNPGRYRRDNVNANYTRSLDDTGMASLLFGRNDFFVGSFPWICELGRTHPLRLRRSQ